MPEVYDFFATNYPQFLSISTTALVCWFVFRFYLKISNQIADLGKEMNERFAKSGERFANLTKEINERAAKSDERFANLTREMNELSANLTKEMNGRFASLIEKMD